MTSRYRTRFIPEFPIWKEEDGFYTCEKDALEAVIRSEGVDEELTKRRMGHGHPLLAQALSGVRLTRYEVQMVEWGISREGKPRIGDFAGLATGPGDY